MFPELHAAFLAVEVAYSVGEAAKNVVRVCVCVCVCVWACQSPRPLCTRVVFTRYRATALNLGAGVHVLKQFREVSAILCDFRSAPGRGGSSRAGAVS